MKKVLFVAHVESHILHFHIPYLQLFHENGYEVHVATNGESKIPYCDVKHNLPFQKSPLRKENYAVFKELKKLLNEENFEIIHCHTPVGGVLARIANRVSNNYKKARMIYTAHGFHFYKGAPITNWMIFYPIERWMAHYTDTLITINQEDYQRAKKFHLKRNGSVELIHGVGVDEKKFCINMSEYEKKELKQSLGLSNKDYVMIFVAELNQNKNQYRLISLMERLIKLSVNYKLILAGNDLLFGKLQKIVKDKKLDKNILFLGYRKDISKLLKISDVAVSSSIREGLPVNLIEASFSGLPVLASNCRGNREIGNIYETDDEFIYKIINKEVTINNDIKKYSLSNVLFEYKRVYFNIGKTDGK